jgi:membrane-associated phospholipid phosphatase
MYEMSLTKEAALLGGTAIYGFVSKGIEAKVKPITIEEIRALNKDDVNFIDRQVFKEFNYSSAAFSDVLVYLLAVAPGAFIFSDELKKDKYSIPVMYIETLGLAALATSLPKGLVTRMRPYAYDSLYMWQNNLSSADTKKSFFSGHSTVAFASAVFTAKVFSDLYPNSKFTPYVIGASLLAAGTVAYLRMDSGMHFPTDVILGAALGSIIGYAIPELHRVGRSNEALIIQHDASLGGNYRGFVVGYSWVVR